MGTPVSVISPSPSPRDEISDDPKQAGAARFPKDRERCPRACLLGKRRNARAKLGNGSGARSTRASSFVSLPPPPRPGYEPSLDETRRATNYSTFVRPAQDLRARQLTTSLSTRLPQQCCITDTAKEHMVQPPPGRARYPDPETRAAACESRVADRQDARRGSAGRADACMQVLTSLSVTPPHAVT
ncbi:hypothetical protein CIB48_g1489 [Xylaria polymorpha]|nr:hypothetical protein CIB48_g1489 [Xylaria polymorpha]